MYAGFDSRDDVTAGELAESKTFTYSCFFCACVYWSKSSFSYMYNLFDVFSYLTGVVCIVSTCEYGRQIKIIALLG